MTRQGVALRLSLYSKRVDAYFFPITLYILFFSFPFLFFLLFLAVKKRNKDIKN